MVRRIPWLAAIAAAALLVTTPNQAQAATSTLDQANDVAAQNYLGVVEFQVQTFTAGRDGTLDRVEVKGFRTATPGPVTLGIIAVDATGSPTGAVLGSGSADTSTLPAFTGDLNGGGWLSAAISPPVQVQAGTRYGLIKPTNANIRLLWSVSTGDTYPSGAGSPNDIGQPYDYLFRTYVLTPEPTAPSCLGRLATIYVRDGVIVGGPSNGLPYQGTLIGTDGQDVIVGTDGNDTIRGGIDNDRICGLGGNDTLSGDTGADQLDGGAGNDTISGGTAADRLTGGPGADVLDGGTALDVATDYSPAEGDIRISIP